jgi:hypothetical protein
MARLETKLTWIIFKDQIRTGQWTHAVFITNTNHFCTVKWSKHMNTLYEQNVVLFLLKLVVHDVTTWLKMVQRNWIRNGAWFAFVTNVLPLGVRETDRLMPLSQETGAGAVAPAAAVLSVFEMRSHSCLGRASSFPVASFLFVCRLRTEPRVHHARTHTSNLYMRTS